MTALVLQSVLWVILTLEAEMSVMAPFVQHLAVAGHGWLVQAHEVAAVDAKGSLAVDCLDGFALFQIAIKKCFSDVPPLFNRNTATTRGIRGFQRFSNRNILVCVAVWNRAQTRSGVDLWRCCGLKGGASPLMSSRWGSLA